MGNVEEGTEIGNFFFHEGRQKFIREIHDDVAFVEVIEYGYRGMAYIHIEAIPMNEIHKVITERRRALNENR